MSATEKFTFPENTVIPFTNTTGATLAKDRVILIGGRAGRVITDVAAGATGQLDTRGSVTMPKDQGSSSFVAGSSVEVAADGKAVNATLGVGHAGRCRSGGGQFETTVVVDLNEPPLQIIKSLQPSAGQDTANQMDVDLGQPTAPAHYVVQVRDTNGQERAGTTVTFVGGLNNIMRIANANLAATDRVWILARW